MSNVTPIKKFKPFTEILMEFQHEVLEDGSFWYRMRIIGTEDWMEWTKAV